jgi:hypothetical protein
MPTSFIRSTMDFRQSSFSGFFLARSSRIAVTSTDAAGAVAPTATGAAAPGDLEGADAKATGEIKSMKVWKIAEAADMNEIYCTVYAHLSLSVHASPQDMARHLLTDESGKITHLIWGPTHEESQVMLRYGMLLLWACVGALGDLFQLDISAKLDSVIQRIKKLTEQPNTQE